MKNHPFAAAFPPMALADARVGILAICESALGDFIECAEARADRGEKRRASTDYEIADDLSVAVLSVRGPISPYFEDSVDPRALAGAIGSLRGVKSLILDIDSPGGHATYVRELANQIRAVSESGTRVVAHIGAGAMAASAAYWIAAAADEIHGSTAGMTGSVGVFSAIFDFSGLLEQAGVKLHLFRDGALKGMGLFGKSLTDDEGAHIQAGVDKVSAEFKGFIRARRPGIAEETMQGQVFDGDEAIAARLLDGHVDDLAELVAMEMERAL
jgi:protease-4